MRVFVLGVLLAWGQPCMADPVTGIRLEAAEWVPKFGHNGAWMVTAAGGREAVGKSSSLEPMALPPGKYDVYWQQDYTHAQVLLARGVEVKDGPSSVPVSTGIRLEAAEWVPKFGHNGAWTATAAGGREAVDRSAALEPLVLPPGKYDVYWQQDYTHAQVLLARGVEVKDGPSSVPVATGIRLEAADWVPKFGHNGEWTATAAGGREAVDRSAALEPLVLPPGKYDVYWQQDYTRSQVLLARGVEVKDGPASVPVATGIRLEVAEWVPKSGIGWVAKTAGGEEIVDRTGAGDPMVLPAGKYDVYWQQDPNRAQVPVARGVEVKEGLSAVPVATGLRLELGGWVPHNARWVVTEAGGSEVIDKSRALDPMVLPAGKYDVHSSQEATVSRVVEGVALKPGELTVVRWPAGVKAKQDRQPKGLPGVGLNGEDVNRAIDRGSEFLWRYVKAEDLGKGGMKLGEDQVHALACLALVHSNAHKRFPDFDAALREFLGRVSPYTDLAAVHPATYKVGVLCMLVESYADSTFLPKLREGARYLLEAQGPGGSWGYNASNVLARGDAFFRDIDSRDDSAPKDDTPAHGVTGPEERWKRVGPWEDGTDGDTSVTQFGTLGLHAASRVKITMPVETWERNLAAYRGRQNMDGGFTYDARGSTGSMTCAGICGVALCRHHLGESDPASDPSIEQGLSWLERNFSVTTNPGLDSFNFYYLYSVERVGRILDTEFIGEHEWYPLGAKELVSSQQPDGRWTGPSEDARVATSFALLFLTRATPTLKPEQKKEPPPPPPVVPDPKPPPPAVEVPKKPQPATVQVVDRAEGPEAGDRRGPAAVLLVLDCSSSMDARVEGNKKYRVARDVIRGLVNEAPDSMQVGLRIFGHNDDDTSEMVWPIGPLSAERRQELEALLRKLKPYGRTPMVRALLDARHDLDGVRQQAGKYIILIGDGKETSGGRMESVRDAYRGADVELVLHVVGFDVQGKGMAEDRRQLQEAAKVTGGKYYDARNAKELADALRAATYVPRPTTFEILDARGEAVLKTGKVNDPPLKLPEGTYQLRLVGAGKPIAIQVVPGKPLTFTIDEIEGRGR